MKQHSGSAVALASEAVKPASVKAKRAAKIASAAALSFGLMSAFAMPAYATAPEVEGLPDGFLNAQAQSLQTVNVDADVLPLEAPDAEVSAEVRAERAAKRAAEEAKAEEERLEAARGEAGDSADATKTKDFSGKDVPAGEGAQGLVSAALAQIGVAQDCTDLVQNSLAAIGLTERRDQGGYDHGVSDFYKYGTVITSGDYAPGDILIWPNAPHTAIYIGNGQAVHGGWGGSTQVGPISPGGEGVPDVVRLSK